MDRIITELLELVEEAYKEGWEDRHFDTSTNYNMKEDWRYSNVLEELNSIKSRIKGD